jgi:hypothetical protein
LEELLAKQNENGFICNETLEMPSWRKEKNNDDGEKSVFR